MEEDIPELIDLVDAKDKTYKSNSKVQSPETKDLNTPKVPITLLTGYLGSGKTTLLQYILTQDHKLRIAVILNEFGSGIERKALNVMNQNKDRNQEKGKEMVEEWLELKNGCLCCSLKDAGVKAIENLLEKSILSQSKIDYIILETTGLADPKPIISMFWLDDQLEAKVYLDGVITLIDAKFGLKYMEEIREDGSLNEALRQVVAADRILINKIDLVDQVELTQLEDKIKSINPTASIRHTQRSNIDLQFILNIQAYTSSTTVPTWNFDLDTISSHTTIPSQVVQTVALTWSSYIPLSKVETWLQHLLWDHKVDNTTTEVEVLRAKGWILVDDQTVFLLQAVQELYEFTKLNVKDMEKDQEGKQSKLVLIGRGLDYQIVQEDFWRKCIEN